MKTFVLLLFIVASKTSCELKSGPFDWLQRDNFDLLNSKLTKVTAKNCQRQSVGDLLMPPESVTMTPRSNLLLDVNTRVFRNRTCLLTLHNLALGRSFFLSYIFKITNRTDNFWMQPGGSYLYSRMGTLVTAFPGCINSTSLIFDANMTYPNWLSDVSLNSTIPFFGVTAVRNAHMMKNRFSGKGPPQFLILVRDRGTGSSKNYTRNPMPWYTTWLPDRSKVTDETKGSYTVSIKYSVAPGKWNDEFQSHTFFGPPLTRLQDNVNLPVKFTQPYFDCGYKNEWLVSAVAPVVDAVPRYRRYQDILEFGETPHRFVGIVKIDTDWQTIDHNPCKEGPGNPGPSMLAGIARCKPTTMCQPLIGMGFKRGSYECVCRPGYRYPYWQDGPYKGIHIESATEEEYKKGFNCIKIDNKRVVPSVYTRQQSSNGLETLKNNSLPSGGSLTRKRRFIKSIKGRYLEMPSKARRAIRRRRDVTDRVSVERIGQIFEHINRVRQARDCKALNSYDLVLPGDVGYGVDKQFEPQGRMALSLAHFLSDCLQSHNPEEAFGRVVIDPFPNPELLHAEVLSNVMSDNKISGFGIWFDEYNYREPVGPRGRQVKLRQLFAPYAFRAKDQRISSVDMAGDPDVGRYLKTDWFRKAKMRWASNTAGLRPFKNIPFFRKDAAGTTSAKAQAPKFFATSYDLGQWSQPHFVCNDFVRDWVVTYTAPFFSRHELIYSKVVFSGVVTVDVKLEFLDINQCTAEFFVPNAFKNTARCDYVTTYCVPQEGKKMSLGAYRCHCKRGHEFPFANDAWFFDGAELEAEWKKKKRGEFNKYDQMKCRTASADVVFSSITTVTIAVTLTFEMKAFL